MVSKAEVIVNEQDDSGYCSTTINGLTGLEFKHLVADVENLILDPQNDGAIFQAASQFNCLEMPHAAVTPDAGISTYENDKTQGPICAVACAAGTLYRNYFVNEYGQGGKKGKQIDCLEGMGTVFENEREGYWIMRNGYALPTSVENLVNLKRKIYGGFYLSRTAAKKLKVGIQWDTEVTKAKGPSRHRITQIYCSALPIGYSTIGKIRDFEPFAKLVLEATYQATFTVAAIKALETNRRVDLYLTKIGGGVFANRSRWIAEAIRKCLRKFEDFPLNVYLVHYGTLEQAYSDHCKGEDASKLISDYITSNISTTGQSLNPSVCNSTAEPYLCGSSVERAENNVSSGSMKMSEPKILPELGDL